MAILEYLQRAKAEATDCRAERPTPKLKEDIGMFFFYEINISCHSARVMWH